MKKLLLILLLPIIFSCNESEKKGLEKRILLDELTNKGTGKSPIMYYESKLFNGIGFDVDQNGELLFEAHYKEGKRDGIWRVWHEAGQLKASVIYKQGKRDGLFQEWWWNGQKHLHGNFKEGIKTFEGFSNIWKYQGSKYGNLDGLWRCWYQNGHQKYEENYKDGRKDGLWKEWSRTSLTDQEQITYLSDEWNYKDGKLDGLRRAWHENGQLSGEWNYKDGEEDGLSRGWYENGQLRWDEDAYKEGKKDGSYKEWKKDGSIKLHYNYKDGKLDGSYKEWYGYPKSEEDGIIRSYHNYKDGKLNGSYKEWDEYGSINLYCHYKDGKRDGLSRIWDGLVRWQVNYKDGKKEEGSYKQWTLTRKEQEDDNLKYAARIHADKTRQKENKLQEENKLLHGNVNVENLNFRGTPQIKDNNIIGKLFSGQEVLILNTIKSDLDSRKGLLKTETIVAYKGEEIKFQPNKAVEIIKTLNKQDNNSAISQSFECKAMINKDEYVHFNIDASLLELISTEDWVQIKTTDGVIGYVYSRFITID